MPEVELDRARLDHVGQGTAEAEPLGAVDQPQGGAVVEQHPVIEPGDDDAFG